jgi:hypothetical protein
MRLTGLLTIVIFCVTQVAQSSQITLNDLRQIIASDQNLITTVHAVYIQDELENRYVENAVKNRELFTNDEYKLHLANQRIVTEEELYLDSTAKSIKLIRTDIRDINSIMKENNIPDVNYNKHNINRSRVYICQGAEGFGVHEGKPNWVVDIWDNNRFADYFLEFPRLGVIPSELLEHLDNVKLQNVAVDGKSLLSVTWESESKQGTVSGEILCDPSINYRFHKIQWSRGGHIFKEIIADDYRNVQGIIYPFSYTKRVFNPKDGTLQNETVFNIDKIEFNIPIEADYFEMYIPSNTACSGMSLDCVYVIEIGKKMKAADLVSLCKKNAF